MKRLTSVLFVLLLCMAWTFAEADDDFVTDDDFVIYEDQVLFTRRQVLIVQGRTLVQAEALTRVLGLENHLHQDEKSLSIAGEDFMLDLSLERPSAEFKGLDYPLEVGAVEKNGHVYIPLRFVAEALGLDVQWDPDHQRVLLDKRDDLVLGILEDIRFQAQASPLDYGVQRQGYRAVVASVTEIKNTYLKEENILRQAMKDLAASTGLDFDASQDLQSMMVKVHGDMMPKHQSSSKDEGWVLQDDFYLLHYDLGYYYGYYEDTQAQGYRFGYTSFDDAYVLSLMPYEDNQRQGISYKVVFNLDGRLRYDSFQTNEKNMHASLDYVRYGSGIETFDKSDTKGGSLVRIEANGQWFIPPLDDHSKSNVYNTGLGYYQWPEGVEYVGFFKDWNILGQGRYYGLEEENDDQDNLVEQRSLEILGEIIEPDMTDQQRVKTIHDYLAKHVRYDHKQPSKALSHTAYGPLILGEGVCDGYAGSFKYLLDLAGVENVLIFGSVNGVDHAWNLVKLGGTYSHYDLTWNDDDKGQSPIYTYYKKDGKFFSETHLWDTEKYKIYFQ